LPTSTTGFATLNHTFDAKLTEFCNTPFQNTLVYQHKNKSTDAKPKSFAIKNRVCKTIAKHAKPTWVALVGRPGLPGLRQQQEAPRKTQPHQ